MIQRFSGMATAFAMVALTAAAPASAGPYDQYRPGKLAEVTAPALHDSAGSVALSPDTDRRDFHVKYTGDHRPIGTATADLIAQYMRTAHAQPGLATAKEEYRFTEGGKDYWVPIEAAAADEMTVDVARRQRRSLCQRARLLSAGWELASRHRYRGSPDAELSVRPRSAAETVRRPPARRRDS